MPKPKVEAPSPQRISATQRRAYAIEMRRGGATPEQIAERLGYATPAMAARDVTRALTMLIKTPTEEVRAVEIARLDGLMIALWPAARRGDLAAVDRVLKIMDRRAKFLGLDAPTRHEIVTIDEIEQEISRLETELAVNDRPGH